MTLSLTNSTLILKFYFISFTEMRENVPPIMNEKVLTLMIRLGDPVVVPCVAYANPKPTYR